MLIFGYLISIKRGGLEMMTPSCILRPSTAIDRGVGFDLGGCLLRTSLSLNTSSQISIFFFTFSHCCCYQHNCNACPWTPVHKNEFSILLVPRCYLVLLFTHKVFWSCCVFDGSLFLCLTVLQLLLGRRWWVVVVAVEGLLGKVLNGSLSCLWCLSPFQQ